MDRRNFVKKAALTTMGLTAAPYILPSGRLFAQTNSQLAGHVVFVLLAGVVRQQESILQRYLSDSQEINIEGNIMPNLFDGQAPEQKIVYGTTGFDGQDGGVPIPKVLSRSLASQGTLFREVQVSKGGTGHYNNLSNAVSGYYGVSQGLQNRPLHPTIFEYARRLGGFQASDVWFVGNGIGNSTPLLNYSTHPDFGRYYGANFFAPTVTFGGAGERHLKGFKNYHPEEELDPIRRMQAFLNQSFMVEGREIPHLDNTEEEVYDIKQFIKQTFERKERGQIISPPVSDNGDLVTLTYAAQVMEWFKPKITVLNMNSIDVCHGDFTAYLKALHRGDHGVGWLWSFIQNNIPEMRDDTIMIVMPEHGRNLNPNPILDTNNWYGYDHSGDVNSRRMWSLMVGPNVPQGLQVGEEDNPDNVVSDQTDIVPTIAEILGFKQRVYNEGLIDPVARSLFDRI